MKSLVLPALLFAAAPAHAADCGALAGKAHSLEGDQVVSTYAELVGCDAAVAEKHFYDFMRSADDVGTLVDLSIAAIDGDVYQPVWGMLDKVPDYSARDEVAKGVGDKCDEHPSVLPFLQGAWSAIGDRQFGPWGQAFVSCGSADLDAWLSQTVADPPAVAYDEKYNTVTEAWVERKGVDALSALEKAAIAAAGEGGPFSTVLDRMAEAVRPAEFGASVPEESQAQLEASLSRIANAVEPEQARLVADRLYQAGAEEQAAALLPRIYPDRVQGKGELMYGVAAIESCDGDAMIHYTTVTEPAKRWSIAADVTELALTSFKSRLKCTPEGDWPVLTTPEPVADKDDVDAWVEEVESEWEGKGVNTKTRSEKSLSLP